MWSHVCKRPDVATMDHRIGYNEDSKPMVNRVCLTCLTHWYGEAEAAVFEFPRQVWDRWMAHDLTPTPPADKGVGDG